MNKTQEERIDALKQLAVENTHDNIFTVAYAIEASANIHKGAAYLPLNRLVRDEMLEAVAGMRRSASAVRQMFGLHVDQAFTAHKRTLTWWQRRKLRSGAAQQEWKIKERTRLENEALDAVNEILRGESL